VSDNTSKSIEIGEAIMDLPQSSSKSTTTPSEHRPRYAEIDSISETLLAPVKETDEDDDTTINEIEDDADDTAGNATNGDDPELDEIATDLGFSEKQIKALKSAGILEESVTDRARARGLLKDDESPSTKSQKDETKAPSKTTDTDWPELTQEQEEDLDPILVKQFKAARESVALIKAQNEELRNSLRQRDVEVMKERLDSSFGALSPEHKRLFGDGGLDELDRNSKEFRNRAKVIQEMDVLERAMRSKGVPVNHKSVFQKALKLTFGDKIQSGAVRNLAESRRAELFSAGRPQNTNRQREVQPETEADRTARATKNLSKMMRAKGALI